MQPPQNIDMSAIREAMQRRAMGGGGTPIAQQVSIPPAGPGGQVMSPLQVPTPAQPTGPLMQAPQPGQPQPGMPQPGGPQGMPPAMNPGDVMAQLQAAGGQSSSAPANNAPQGGFDDKTRAISKALVAQLLKVL